MVCHDCCCGTTRKHPGVDHEGLRAELPALADDEVRVQVVDCLGECERSNVVLVRDLRRPRAERDAWFGDLLDGDDVRDLAGWVSGACGSVPATLAHKAFERRRPG